jgi:hypothetical protein
MNLAALFSWLAQMQVVRVEIAQLNQAIPVANVEPAAPNIHEAGVAQDLQRAAHRRQRHAHELADFRLSERKTAQSGSHEPGEARTIVLFAEKMRQPRLQRPRTVVGDGFAEDGGVDQRFAPERKRGSGPRVKEIEQGAVRNEGHNRLVHGADGMIHLFQEHSLRIRDVTGDVQREILAAAAAQRVIASQCSLQHNDRAGRPVALQDDLLVRPERASRVGKPTNPGNVRRGEPGMLLQLPDQRVMPGRQCKYLSVLIK